eukprot:COSAG01_NODE_1699_length_9452_cov_47.169251_4_plen_128_part_00
MVTLAVGMSAARPHQLRYWEQPIPEEEEHEKREEGSSARQKQQRKDENKQFRCHVCKLQVKYSFYGRRPANCSVVFLEPAVRPGCGVWCCSLLPHKARHQPTRSHTAWLNAETKTKSVLGGRVLCLS